MSAKIARGSLHFIVFVVDDEDGEVVFEPLGGLGGFDDPMGGAGEAFAEGGKGGLKVAAKPEGVSGSGGEVALGVVGYAGEGFGVKGPGAGGQAVVVA